MAPANVQHNTSSIERTVASCEAAISVLLAGDSPSFVSVLRTAAPPAPRQPSSALSHGITPRSARMWALSCTRLIAPSPSLAPVETSLRFCHVNMMFPKGGRSSRFLHKRDFFDAVPILRCDARLFVQLFAYRIGKNQVGSALCCLVSWAQCTCKMGCHMSSCMFALHWAQPVNIQSILLLFNMNRFIVALYQNYILKLHSEMHKIKKINPQYNDLTIFTTNRINLHILIFVWFNHWFWVIVWEETGSHKMEYIYKQIKLFNKFYYRPNNPYKFIYIHVIFVV